MAVERIKEKWVNQINELIIGATPQKGGRRSCVVKVGGESTLPFLFQEGQMPNPPVVAMEIWDIEPVEWPDHLKRAIGDGIKDPILWAKKGVEAFGVDLICLVLKGSNPEYGDFSPQKTGDFLKRFLTEIKAPLIITGSGDKEKDNEVLAHCSQVAKGENCLFGMATQDNYKTLTASCMADGHSIIAESPIDINIAKQVNILISDMGFDTSKIAMHPSTAALGYGMEYVYSIMERSRLAALMGDKMLSMPIILFIGQDVWKVKETKADQTEQPEWGELEKRAIMWETITATTLLHAGADILVMRHPEAIRYVKEEIATLMGKPD